MGEQTPVVNLMGTDVDLRHTESPSLTVDRNMVRAYLTEMYLAVPGLLQVWTTPRKGSGEFFTTDEAGIEQAVTSIEASYSLGAQNIYARVTTMKGRPTKEHSRGVAADSASFIGLWTDIDFGTVGHAAGEKLPPTREAAEEVYENSGLPPASITVYSGGGLYHIVKLAEPLDITDAETRMQINALSRRWQQRVQAASKCMGYSYGTGVSDLARVLRIPGTINAKDWDNRRHTAYKSSGARYTLEELEAACPAPPKPERRTVQLTGEPAKDARARFDHHLAELRATRECRNDALNRLAFMSFQYVGAGQLDAADVEREFTAAGLDCGLDESEVRATVNSAKGGIDKPYVWRDFTRPEKTAKPEAQEDDMWAGHTATAERPVEESAPALQTAEAQPPPPAPPAPPAGDVSEPEPGPAGLPPVDISNEADGLINLTRALADGHLPEVYVREGRIVHVTEVSGTHVQKGQLSTHRAVILDASYMRNMAGRHLITVKTNAKGGMVKTLPTKQLCDAVLAEHHWPTIDRLRDVVGAPFVRGDGTICQEPGYDTATGMWLSLPPGLRHVPENPSDEDLAEARKLILDTVLRDFPWVSRADRANYIALLFTPMLRELVDCLTPLGMITAAAPSSGKSLLSDMIACIHGGRMTTLPKQDEELEKKITAFFMNEMVPTVTFDNVGLGHTLNSPVLAQLLTQRKWDGRILGRTENIARVNDKLWMVTGNNLQINNDMRSRSILVHIDPRVEKPEERDTTSFAVGNLDVWMRQPENKARLVWSLLVMIRAWAAKGMPKSDDEMRTYTPWAQTLGGLLAFHGIEGFRENKDELADADEEKMEWSLLLQIWNERHGANWITASQLLADYQNTLFSSSIGSVDPWQGTFPLGANGKVITPKGLGKRFQYYKDRPSDGWVLRYRKVPGRAALWRAERMPDAPAPAPQPPVPEQRREPEPAAQSYVRPTLDTAVPPEQRAREVRSSVNSVIRSLNLTVNPVRRTEENRQ